MTSINARNSLNNSIRSSLQGSHFHCKASKHKEPLGIKKEKESGRGMGRGVQFQFIYFLQKQYKSFRYRHSIYYKNVISRLRDINCFKQYYLYILSSAVCLLSAELVLPVILNKTCMEPKEEGTLVIFTWNILNNQNQEYCVVKRFH